MLASGKSGDAVGAIASDFLFAGVVQHTGRPKRVNQIAIAHAKPQAKKPLGFEIFDILAKAKMIPFACLWLL
ncbi:hypothetical protein [Coleofasciculus sp. H7-2]|uniref:hypothetical protein n=1 Tax=Coleofasciculus sp. H7-2 TaxID=3351545 RepID=UPI003670055C